MYSGLVFGSFGLALATGSPVRTFFAAVLTFLLNEKAATEELFLEEMHGKEARPTHRSLHDRVGAVNADPY
jgi:protein-S-isoprenylcysteine O-methyltransferase Ste14